MAEDKIVLARLDVETASLIKGMQDTKKEMDELQKQQEKLISKGKENSAQFLLNQADLNTLNNAYRQQSAALNAQAAAMAGHGKTFNDYKQQLIDAADSISLFNGGLGGFITRAQEAGGAGPLVSGAFKGMAEGIGGMTKSALTFIATPIGFVIAALAGVIALVQNAMNGSSESAGKITKIFTTFSVITDSLMKLLKPLGDFLIDGIAAGFDLAGKAAETAMGWISDGLSFLGFDESAESVKNFTEEVKNTAIATNSLKEVKKELAAQMSVQEVANEKAKQQMDELKRKIDDQSLSEQERMEALKKAAAIESENFNQRKVLSNQAYNTAVQQAMLGKNLSVAEIAELQRNGAAYAEKMMKVKGFTQEEIDSLKSAQLEKMRISGQETQMVQNQQAAREKLEADFEAKREAAAQKRQQQEDQRRAKAQKAADDAIQKQKLELDLYIEQQGVKAKTMAEELALAEAIAAKKKAIADAEYKASDKSANARLQRDLAHAQITNQLAEKQRDAAIANAKKQLDDYIAANKSKLDNEKFLSAEMYNAEVARLDGIAQKEREYQAERLKQGAINQETYNAEIKRIDDENTAADDALKADREEAEKAKQAIDLENKMAADTANMDYDLKFQLDKINAQRKQELDEAEKTGADKSAINAKFDKQEVDAKKAVMENKIALAQSTFGNLAAILGKESAAGKAIAVAQATMDTYKGATAAYASLAGISIVGPALGAVAAAAAVASGIANVKKITSTKPPKAEKGALFNIGGKRHSAGGTMFHGEDGTAFEAEQGELIGVMNRNAAKHFMAFNNTFPAGSGAASANYFAGGGIVSREIISPGLNTDELAAKIAQANRSIPAPVVAVQDIITEGNSYVKVRDGANF